MDLGKQISKYLLDILKEVGIAPTKAEIGRVTERLGASSEEELEDEVENMVQIFREAEETDLDTAIDNHLLRKSQYLTELRRLQVDLVTWQDWVVDLGKKIVVLFEGRDAAGKGGVLKRITQRMNPRVYKEVALTKPTEEEKTQWYFQRYVRHLPSAGNIVFFDRSWYNRAGVERVMGFCSDEEYREFYRTVPEFEQMLVRSGITLIKYWFSVSDEEQQFRFYCRINDPLKQWKLSPMDLESRIRWEKYTKAKEYMFKKSSTAWAPWYVVPADDKKRARLNCISHLLSLFDYKPVRRPKVKLPPRKRNEGYRREKIPEKMIIPQIF